jgi:hypothetical protein
LRVFLVSVQSLISISESYMAYVLIFGSIIEVIRLDYIY